MKKALTILLLLGLALPFCARAQERKLQYRPYIDQRRLHWGFCFGAQMQDMELRNNGRVDPETGEQWYADVDMYSPGFNVGVYGELRLNKYLSLRLNPTMYFGQKRVLFHEQRSGMDSTQVLKSTYLSLPLSLKLHAPRCNNFRPYFIAGVSPTIDFTTRKHRALRTRPFDCYIEVGMGCEMYFSFFKLIPELKFCFGLADILQHKRDDLIDSSLMKFTDGIDKAHSKMIVLTLYFE